MEEDLVKINELVKMLINNTERGDLTWSKRKSFFSGDNKYTFSAFSFDKKTEFCVEFRLSKKLDKIISYTTLLSMYNTQFVDGFKCFSVDDILFNNLQDIIFVKFIKGKLMPEGKDYIEIVDEILNSLSIDVIRNHKINEIIKNDN
jgi:hypothetical protein